MTPEQLEACREVFESWIIEQYPILKPKNLRKWRTDTGYDHYIMNCQWSAFKAAYLTICEQMIEKCAKITGDFLMMNTDIQVEKIVNLQETIKAEISK